jgi:hypothetical protein
LPPLPEDVLVPAYLLFEVTIITDNDDPVASPLEFSADSFILGALVGLVVNCSVTKYTYVGFVEEIRNAVAVFEHPLRVVGQFSLGGNQVLEETALKLGARIRKRAKPRVVLFAGAAGGLFARD